MSAYSASTSTHSTSTYSKSVGMALVEHARNRLATVLVVVFIPLWVTLARLVVANQTVPFYLHATGHHVAASLRELTQLGSADQAIALIVGFQMFHTTVRTANFDRRLTLAGFPRGALLLGKLTALLAVASAVSVYATAVLCVFWRPQQPGLLMLSYLVAALTYGGIGVLLGVALRSELAGLFLILMTSFVDITLQDPATDQLAGGGVVRFMPSYGVAQADMAAAFQSVAPWRYLTLGVLWFAGTCAAAAIIVRLRARGR